LLKSIMCPAFMLCSATADFSGRSNRMCLMCSLHMASMDLPVWPMYTFPLAGNTVHTRDFQA
jgi:hypothetical protein